MFRYLLHYNETQSLIIQEPKNVQNVTSRLKRDLNSHGCFFEYTERELKIGFVCEARKILEEHYQAKGTNAKVYFEIQFKEHEFAEWKQDYYGRINFKTRVYDREYFQCSVYSEDIITKFKNNIEVSTDLSSRRALSGESISQTDKTSILLHSKTIIRRSEFKINEAYSKDNQFETINLLPSNYVIPFYEVVSEVEGTIQPTPGIMSSKNPLAANIWYTGLIGDKQRTINIDTRLRFSIKTNSDNEQHFYTVRLISYNLGNSEFNVIADLSERKRYYKNRFVSDEVVYSGPITLSANEALIYTVYLENTANTTNTHFPTINFDPEESFLSFTESTQVDDQSFDDNFCYGYTYKDALNINLALTTGKENLLKSSLLSDTVLKTLAIAPGKQIRGFTDEATIVKTKDLFHTLKCLVNAGYGVEGTGENQKIVCELMEYFYAGEQIMKIDNVTDYSERPAEDMLINQAMFGFKKYADENGEGQKNTIDDVHTEHEYHLPLETVKNSLELISDYIASAYLIEEGRRKNYKTTSTERWNHDDDIFLFQMRPAKITLLGVDFLFNKCEKDEPFIFTDGLIDPESMYNLRWTPKRMMLNHYKYLNSFLYFNSAEDLIRNQKVINNRACQTQFNPGEEFPFGDYQGFTRTEGEDEQINRIGGGERTFKPDIVSFKKGLCYEDFQLLRRAHSNRLTGVDKGKNYGFITVDTGLGYETEFFLTELKYNNITRQAEFEGIKKAGPVNVVPDAPGILQETLRYNFITTEDGIVISLE